MIRLTQLLQAVTISVLFSLAAPVAATQEVENFTSGLDRIALQKYEQAHHIFADLMPLGSSDAAYLLGLMAIEGQGTEYNPVVSLAYLKAAKAWGNQEADAMITQIEPHLSAEQLTAAEEQFKQLNDNVAVAFHARALNLEPQPRNPLKSPHPSLSVDMFNEGNHGWFEAIIAINAEGDVVGMQALNNAPRGFLRSFNQTLRRWEYPASESISITTIIFNYMIKSEQPIVDGLAAYNQVKRQADIGATQEQFYIAGLVEEIQRLNNEEVSAELREQINALPSPFYWYERAARNGHLQSQRFLALREGHPEWAEYLIEKGDADVMAWHGIRLYTQSSNAEERARGRELLERAALVGSDIGRTLLENI